MNKQPIGVLGASSLVGECVLAACLQDEISVIAFSRQEVKVASQPDAAISWKKLPPVNEENQPLIKNWLCLAPIWVLPEYFSMLESYGVKRIVALSSTSCFTKHNSSDAGEQEVAAKLLDAESQLKQWAQQQKVDWIVLRPTLIYGLGRDKNISTIITFIQRFGFFPLFGVAQGKRQPIHVEDVATACLLVLNTPSVVNQAYNITGGETLAYDEMVKRIFAAVGKKPYLIHLPLSMFRLAIKILQFFPQFKKLNVAMAERMNQDLVFDCSKAKHDFNFAPSPFMLKNQDIVASK
jgi:NAD dependent epimerase/dehydratase family